MAGPVEGALRRSSLVVDSLHRVSFSTSSTATTVQGDSVNPYGSCGPEEKTASGSYVNFWNAIARSNQEKNGYSSHMWSAIGWTAIKPALWVQWRPFRAASSVDVCPGYGNLPE